MSKAKQATWAVRLDLTQAQHERLESMAREFGLSKAAYCRKSILETIRSNEDMIYSAINGRKRGRSG